MSAKAAPPLNPRAATWRATLTALLLVTILLTTATICFAVIRFALPREPALPAGMVADFTWAEPEYVSLRPDLAVFLVREGDTILALDAASTRSGCRIGWLEDQEFYRDPCCGASWERDGSPRWAHYTDLQPQTRYDVEIIETGEIFVLPWRAEIARKNEPC